MAKVIRDYIRKLKPTGFLLSDADKILDTIIEAGMLPPRHSEYEDKVELYPKGYEWELEDEV